MREAFHGTEDGCRSDLSGYEIDEKDAAQLVIKYTDARRGQIVLDVNASEVDDLAAREHVRHVVAANLKYFVGLLR